MSKEKNGFLSKYSQKRKEYKPNVIHDLGMHEIIIDDDSVSQYKDPSVTDKESYRITLANIRSFMANPRGSSNAGQYSIPAGKDYDPDFDFSYLNRKDLTIVDVQNFIDNYKARLENYDNEMKIKIEEQLEKADKLQKEMIAKEKENSSDSSE